VETKPVLCRESFPELRKVVRKTTAFVMALFVGLIAFFVGKDFGNERDWALATSPVQVEIPVAEQRLNAYLLKDIGRIHRMICFTTSEPFSESGQLWDKDGFVSGSFRK
jgi:hypothetical protein